jgi:hypothetical protein
MGTRRLRSQEVIGNETVAMNPASKTGTKNDCPSLRPVTNITTAAAVSKIRVACSFFASSGIVTFKGNLFKTP